MGHDYSKSYLSTAFPPVHPPVDVINGPEAQLPTVARLRLATGVFLQESPPTITLLEGQSLDSERTYLQVSKRLGSDTALFLSNDGQPVANLKRQQHSWGYGYTLHAKDTETDQPLAYMQLIYTASNATFGVYRPGENDPSILVKGNLSQHQYFMFYGHPKKGGQLLAKILRKDSEAGWKGFEVHVAPVVDLVLVLSAAIMVDDYEYVCKGK